MRKFEKIIGHEQAVAICDGLEENGYEIEDVAEGCLIDSLFYNLGENTLYLGETKVRKYLMLLEHYATEWTSNYLLIMTDDEAEYYGTMEKFQEREETA